MVVVGWGCECYCLVFDSEGQDVAVVVVGVFADEVNASGCDGCVGWGLVEAFGEDGDGGGEVFLDVGWGGHYYKVSELGR